MFMYLPPPLPTGNMLSVYSSGKGVDVHLNNAISILVYNGHLCIIMVHSRPN